MISVKVDGLDRVMRGLDAMAARQVPFAAAVALTRTAKRVQQETVEEMRRRFDRPTPFTLKSIYMRPAKKSDLTAMVWLKDQPAGKSRLSMAEIIGHQFTGGSRIAKPIEFWLARAGLISPSERVVPGAAARLDQYGNMSRGQVQQILSQLKIGPDPAQWATKSARSRRHVRQAGELFWSRGGHLPRGVWMRQGRHVRPVLIVVSGTSYRRRIDLQRIGKQVTAQHFNDEFNRAFAEAMRTAR
jgi:hypothetical protein